jgi:catechol 2,3-dioxygenase-like lactoylglutathione lyase family enzyme
VAIFTRPRYGTEERHPLYEHGIVFLYTENVDEVGTFYIDVLGFPLKQGSPHFHEPGHSYWLDAGPHVLVIHQAEKYLPGPFDQPRNSAVLWIDVDDAPDEILDRLEDAGLDVIFCDRDPASNVRRNIVFRDIEGRPIGIYANG